MSNLLLNQLLRLFFIVYNLCALNCSLKLKESNFGKVLLQLNKDKEV